LLKKFGLLHQEIAFANDEGIDMIIMTTTLHSNIDYESSNTFKVYEGTYYGHVMSKTH
jgi:hypothetical protein